MNGWSILIIDSSFQWFFKAKNIKDLLVNRLLTACTVFTVATCGFRGSYVL